MTQGCHGLEQTPYRRGQDEQQAKISLWAVTCRWPFGSG